jgi:hypothetical protein
MLLLGTLVVPILSAKALVNSPGIFLLPEVMLP